MVAAGATVEQRPCATPCALALRPRTGASSSCTRRPGAGGPWRRHRATRGRAGRTRRGRWRARCRPPPRPRPRPAAQPARCASRSSWTAGSWRPTLAASRSPPSRRPARGLGGADRRRLGRGRRRGRALPAPRLEARLVDPRPGPAGTTATTRREVATALRHYAGRLAAKGRAPGSIGLTGMESKGVFRDTSGGVGVGGSGGGVPRKKNLASLPWLLYRSSSASLFESLRNIGAARNLGALSSPLANSRPNSLRTPLILRLFTGKIATERNFLESRGYVGPRPTSLRDRADVGQISRRPRNFGAPFCA